MLSALWFSFLLLYGLPAFAAVVFAVCLIRFLILRKKNRRLPGSVPEGTAKNARIWLIVSAVVFGVLAVILIALTVLLSLAIAYM